MKDSPIVNQEKLCQTVMRDWGKWSIFELSSVNDIMYSLVHVAKVVGKGLVCYFCIPLTRIDTT